MIFESALLSVTQGLVGLTSLWDGDMTVPLTLNTYLQIRRISWSFTLVYRWRMISQGFNLAMCENDVWRNSGVRRIDCLVFYECTCKFEVSMGYVAPCMFIYGEHVNLAVFLFYVYVYLISSEKWGTCRERVQCCRLHFQQQCLCKRYVKVRLKTKFLYLVNYSPLPMAPLGA